ncbi:unnamed protein product, partial [Choristocarpus tenellus]
ELRNGKGVGVGNEEEGTAPLPPAIMMKIEEEDDGADKPPKKRRRGRPRKYPVGMNPNKKGSTVANRGGQGGKREMGGKKKKCSQHGVIEDVGKDDKDENSLCHQIPPHPPARNHGKERLEQSIVGQGQEQAHEGGTLHCKVDPNNSVGEHGTISGVGEESKESICGGILKGGESPGAATAVDGAASEAGAVGTVSGGGGGVVGGGEN